MEHFLRSLPDAAKSPYSLAAYCVAALLFVYAGAQLRKLRLVLREAKQNGPHSPTQFRKLIETLTETRLPDHITGPQWIQLKKFQATTTIILASLIALVAVCALALARPAGGKLTLVDSTIQETEKFPVLDVSFTNTGPIAVIKEARFHVERVWEIQTGWKPTVLLPSWQYDVNIKILRVPYVEVLPLERHVVRTGTADRFTVVLGNDAPPSLSRYCFRMTVEFIYNDGESLTSRPLLFIAPPANVNPARNNGGDFKAAFRHNFRVLEECDLSSAKLSPAVTQLAAEHSERHIPESAAVACDKREVPSERERAVAMLEYFGHRARAVVPQLRRLLREEPDTAVSKQVRTALVEIEGEPWEGSVSTALDRDRIAADMAYWSHAPEDLHDRERPTWRNKEEAEYTAADWASRGYDEYNGGRIEDAIASLERAEAMGEPDYFTFGRALQDAGRHAEAVVAFRRFIEKDGGYSWAWNNMGNSLMEMGRLGEARACLDRAVVEGPKEPMHLRNRAIILIGQREIGAAFGDMERAAQLSEWKPRYVLELAVVSVIAGRGGNDVKSIIDRVLGHPTEEESAVMDTIVYVAWALNGRPDEVIASQLEGRLRGGKYESATLEYLKVYVEETSDNPIVHSGIAKLLQLVDGSELPRGTLVK